ncbi:DUF6471 domain-containing protein [Skermanella stibiiresistens]|uniref:DUF6471 domain-containing protein n=1 Tax=Skermanella stibiiresistens TaxID=913326 RepID=UPI003CCB9C8F
MTASRPGSHFSGGLRYARGATAPPADRRRVPGRTEAAGCDLRGTGPAVVGDGNKASVASKLSRGGFTAAFFLASMKAIGCPAVRMEHL